MNPQWPNGNKIMVFLEGHFSVLPIGLDCPLLAGQAPGAGPAPGARAGDQRQGCPQSSALRASSDGCFCEASVCFDGRRVVQACVPTSAVAELISRWNLF